MHMFLHEVCSGSDGMFRPVSNMYIEDWWNVPASDMHAAEHFLHETCSRILAA